MKVFKKMTFSKEQAMKLLACLQHSIYKVDENLSEEERRLLIDYSEDLMWDIADRYNIDWNKGYIDVKTLEFKNFSGLNK